jgi:hypothetical protein
MQNVRDMPGSRTLICAKMGVRSSDVWEKRINLQMLPEQCLPERWRLKQSSYYVCRLTVSSVEFRRGWLTTFERRCRLAAHKM